MKGISYSGYLIMPEINYISSALVTKQGFDARQSRTHASENGERSNRSSDASLALINMNGRMYDPVLGRMLSPDNYVQNASSTQNFNRYSYCLNNPLKYTDPTGNDYSPDWLFQQMEETEKELRGEEMRVISQFYDPSLPSNIRLKMMRHSEMVIDGGGLEVQQYHNYKDWYLKDQNGWQYVNTQDLGNSTELAWVGNGQDGETGPPIAGNAQGDGGTWDAVTNQRIEGLDPRLQGSATDFINAVQSKLRVTLRISEGYRSIAQQNIDYAKGRTAPGSIVTYAKGGESPHNYGLAFDVAGISNGQLNYNLQ